MTAWFSAIHTETKWMHVDLNAAGLRPNRQRNNASPEFGTRIRHIDWIAAPRIFSLSCTSVANRLPILFGCQELRWVRTTLCSLSAAAVRILSQCRSTYPCGRLRKNGRNPARFRA